MTNKIQSRTWQRSLAEAITNPQQLLALLDIKPEEVSLDGIANRQFKLRVPHGFVKRMKRGDVTDPLLRQVLPVSQELLQLTGFNCDPLSEKEYSPVPGLLHKYHGRVLLMVTGDCPIHCRYCFRRHFSYTGNIVGGKNWRNVMQYLRCNPSIEEVIYSGGDPLIADDCYLEALTEQIAAVPHIKLLRIHSRMPIVLPERVTNDLASLFSDTRLQVVFVTHCNHANEIDATVTQAVNKLRQAGLTILNQAVLLKGVNDSVHALQALSYRLFEIGVLPYYLHLLDPVQGAAHFLVDETCATDLHEQIQSTLPGYLVPRLVREQVGATHKLVVREAHHVEGAQPRGVGVTSGLH